MASYRIAAPDEYLAITGMGVKSVKITRAAWVWPFQQCMRFSVQPHDYAMNIQAMTKEKLQFLLPVVFTVGPDVNHVTPNHKLPVSSPDAHEGSATDASHDAPDDGPAYRREDHGDALLKYALLLAKAGADSTHRFVEGVVKGIIEGETRVLASSMTMGEILAEREMFKNCLIGEIQGGLDQFGLKVYTADVQVPKYESKGDTFLDRILDDIIFGHILMQYNARTLKKCHETTHAKDQAYIELIQPSPEVERNMSLYLAQHAGEMTVRWRKEEPTKYLKLESTDEYLANNIVGRPPLDEGLPYCTLRRGIIIPRGLKKICSLAVAAGLLTTGVAAAPPGSWVKLATGGFALTSWGAGLTSIQINESQYVPMVAKISTRVTCSVSLLGFLFCYMHLFGYDAQARRQALAGIGGMTSILWSFVRRESASETIGSFLWLDQFNLYILLAATIYILVSDTAIMDLVVPAREQLFDEEQWRNDTGRGGNDNNAEEGAAGGNAGQEEV